MAPITTNILTSTARSIFIRLLLREPFEILNFDVKQSMTGGGEGKGNESSLNIVCSDLRWVNTVIGQPRKVVQ